jgi:hypothetical protein
MPIIDMSFNNPRVSAFFSEEPGKNVAPCPVDELMYLHEHPLVQPNFLSQIEVMINESSEAVSQTRAWDAVAPKLGAHLVAIGNLMPKIDKTSAEEVLLRLREVYRIVSRITGKRTRPAR